MTNRETMPTFGSQDGRKEMRDWVESHTVEEVSFWTEKILKENPQANPLIFQRFDYFGSEMLKAIVVYENNPQFTEKIFDGLKQLSDRTLWHKINEKQIKFANNLLSVIGMLKIKPLYTTLLGLVANQTLQQEHLGEHATNLHATALASLGSFGCDEGTAQYFERDIQNPNYAAISYRMLWRWNFELAKTYANHIRELGQNNTNFPTDALLYEAGQHE